ncbi:MAG TPA: tetratricopeptide repeat protein [Candidatus Dormibacteraeota bacterium]|nr:tetratricopeptide repeat protein [Candidatus Dormibacteraeota bacterium]
MNCQEVEERDILEEYLLDRLAEPEREEFEKHYFECGTCFSQLQTRLALQTELRRQPATPARARGAGLLRIWAPAFAAIVILLSAGIWWYSARNRQPSQQVAAPPVRPNVPVQVQSPSAAPSLEELARVEPPPYSGVVLRGAEDESHETFHKAMQFYVKGDYAKAIPGVRAAAEASPQSASFNFYLGACYLLAGQTDPAIVSFRQTVSLGDPAYSESAHFYLAKAYLRKKDVARAKDELQKTVQFHGSLESEAAEILRQLRN